MSLNAALRLMAGLVILTSLVLSYYSHPDWLYLTAFVGLNLFQSSFSRWCPAVYLFRKIGLSEESCDSSAPSVHQGVHFIAGSAVLITVLPVILLNLPVNLLLATGVIGLSLTQSAFTGWCPAMSLAAMLGCGKAIPRH
ncbi:YgaP family membrane protein [Neptuniibacter halophilus]|uniref:YgaP family membrane protein n=1 Tax=Neptuniibacter halophilus TaxID=651666 RepID=UPI00257297DD|nr:DUF2892 domain-containing protein [Neptuniibacter halophilus]